MKKPFKTISALFCAGVMTCCIAGCNDGKKPLGTPSDPTAQPAEKTYLDTVDDFAAAFAPKAYALTDGTENVAVSPASVYAALALSAACANGNTRAEILSALNCDYETLSKNFASLYGALNNEKINYEGELVSTVQYSNSLWINKGTPVKDECIVTLSEKFYAYSYYTDFLNDNAAANQAIRDFIKEKTHGLIDKDFDLSPETCFTLINALYLKDVWRDGGDDLPYTEKDYAFKQADGTTKNTKLLQGIYADGRAYETESYSTFYAVTDNGYHLKFIVPRDGYAVNELFTEETLSTVNDITDWNADAGNGYTHKTRCLFPEFKANYDESIAPLLNEMGIKDLFDKEACDFAALTDEQVYCEQIQHVTDLTVDKKGVEGAAVTVEAMSTESVPKYVYHDFTVDRAFAFILTDRNNVTLFSGVVNKL